MSQKEMHSVNSEKRQSISDLDGPEALERIDKWLEGAPPVGFHPSVSEKEYRAWNAVNWSMLKHMKRAAAAFIHHWKGGETEDTEAMLEGRVFHAALFEPGLMTRGYVVQPIIYPSEKTTGRGDNKVTTTIDKAWNNNATYCRDFIATNRAKGIEVVTRKQMTKANGMAASVMALPDWADYTKGAQYELPIVWEDAMTGLICKAKLDCYQSSTGQILDAKKTQRSAEWRSFAWMAYRYQYFEQASMYRDGVNAILTSQNEPLPPEGAFIFAVVEDSPPYLPAMYCLIDDPQHDSYLVFQHGRTIWHNLLNQLSACIRNDYWPGHNPSPPDGKTAMRELTPPDGMILDGVSE